MLPDFGKLIDAIEMKLAAIDINSRQAAQTTMQQFRAIDARGDETADAFRELAERADGFNHTLSWHLIMVRRMSRWIDDAELASRHRQGLTLRPGLRPEGGWPRRALRLNAYFSIGHNPGGFHVWWRRWHGGLDRELDYAYLMRLAGRSPGGCGPGPR